MATNEMIFRLHLISINLNVNSHSSGKWLMATTLDTAVLDYKLPVGRDQALVPLGLSTVPAWAKSPITSMRGCFCF